MYSEIPYGIDSHGHCKTWTFPSYGKKSAMQILIEEAKGAGIGIVFDMPNIENPVTKSPVVRKADVDARLNFARQQGVLQNYRTYIGATQNPKQLEEAAGVALENDFVPGIKAFMGTSVGTLGITKEDEQRAVFATLADCGYDGVIALHCEDDSKFNSRIWDPKNPITHCLARPLEAELSSVEKNLGFAVDTGFEGAVLGCHITSGKSIELFKEANKNYGLKVAVEVSPHHNLLSMDHMEPLGALGGKMNPPLRHESEREVLLDYTKHETEIPIMVGTDNAKHPFFKKIETPYMSGFGVEVYTIYGELLSRVGSDPSVSSHRVEDLTYHNILKVFGKEKCGAKYCS